MNSEIYAQKRDLLRGLLEKTIATLTNLSSKHKDLNVPQIEKRRTEIETVARRVYEDQFRIALVAPFQGGKSTTFDALVDGMEISPRGDGAISTSASVIHAWNVEKPNDEGVEVIWRTKQELVQVAAELLEKELTDLDVNRFSGVGTFGYETESDDVKRKVKGIGDVIDLDNKKDRALFQKAVDAKTKEYFKDQAAFKDDDLPVLIIATIIGRYYGSDFIKKTMSEKYFPMTVGSLIRFPDKYRNKVIDFLKGGEVFEKNELLFAFVKEVKCRIHNAAGLRSIGTVVTDCPGLSASSYDTKIAMEIFAQSDAVWYLMDGRAIGNAMLKDISKAVEAAGGNLFATTNMKADVNPSKGNIVENIIPNQKAQLEQKGLKVDIKPYHALLALLAVQGPRILNGSLDDVSLKELLKQAKGWGLMAEDPKDAWIEMATHCLYLLRVSAYKEFMALSEKLSQEGIDIVRKESCLDDILEAIKQYVIDNKAESILINNGANRAITALDDGIEKPLKVREERALEVEEEAKKKNDQKKVQLEDFQDDAKDALEALQNDTPDRRLAEDAIDKIILPAIPEVAENAARKINSTMGIWSGMYNILNKWRTGEDNQAREIQKILREEMEKRVQPSLGGWIKTIISGKNIVLQDSLLKTVDKVRKRLIEKWDKQVELKTELPPPTGDYLNASTDIRTLHVNLVELSTNGQLIDIGAFVAALAAGFALGFFLGPLGIVFGVIAGLVIGFLKGLYLGEEALIKDMSCKICSELNSELSVGGNGRANVVNKLARESTSKIRIGYLRIFQIALQEQKDALDRQCEQTLEDLKKGEVERKRIAAECHEIRTKHIEPLHKEIEAFRKETLSEIKQQMPTK